MFPTLNLPSFELTTKHERGKVYIFDIIRKKYLLLTPEEWVRQHVVHCLINHYDYPKGLIKLESGLKYNKLQKRTDILVYDRDGKPRLLVECKAASVAIGQDTFEQAARYNHVVKAPFLVVSNGLNTFCCGIDHHNGSFLFMEDIPAYNPAN